MRFESLGARRALCYWLRILVVLASLLHSRPSLYAVPLDLGQFAPTNQVIDFETGSTALPSVNGLHFSGGDATSYFPNTPYFGSQYFGNLNGSTFLDIYFDQPQQAVGAFLIDRSPFDGVRGVIETVYDRSNNVVESASALYPSWEGGSVFLGIAEPTARIYRVEWQYIGGGYFGVDNVNYGSAIGIDQLPDIPTGLSATSQGATVTLNWSVANRATDYIVKRGIANGGPYTTVASGVSGTTCTDTNITYGSVYYYVVTAANDYGESAISQQAVAFVVDHFAFDTIPSPQTSSIPFAVNISARGYNGLILSNFNGSVQLSAAGDRGDVPVSPATTASFLNGQWTGMLTLGVESPDTNIRLRASSNALGGVSAPFDAVAPAIQQFNLSALQIAYNPVVRRIYATVPFGNQRYSNSLVVIDPAIGRIENSYYLGDSPTIMSLSDDGQFLYLGFSTSNVFRRFKVESQSVDLQVPLIAPVSGMAALPGSPHSVAVNNEAVGIFDDGVQRSNSLPVGGAIIRAASATNLLTIGGGYPATPLTRFTVDASGVTSYSSYGLWFPDDMKYQGGRLFLSGGRVVDPETERILGQIQPCATSEPDLATGRIFSMAYQPVFAHPNAWTLYTFDPICLQQVGQMPIQGTINGPASLIRWGSNGVAFTSTDVYGNPQSVWLVRSSLVPADPPTDLAIVMTDTPHPGTLGDPLVYQIQVTNQGPNDARAALFQDVLPQGATLLSATSTLGALSWSNGVITCDIGTLSNGSSGTITLTTIPHYIGVSTNLALVSSLSLDPEMLNNSASTATPIQHSPFAQTQQPWRQDSASVTLQGMVTPNGLSSIAWFEWGLRGNYDNTTAPVSVGSGSGVVRVGTPITGLVTHTLYNCRVVASNEAGVCYGAIAAFSTGHKITGWGDNSSGQTTIPTGLSNAVAIAAGRYHGLSLRNDGKVIAWGINNYGQTNVPAGLANVVAVAAGDSQSVALRSNGTVAAWGQNYAGATNVPAGLSGVVAIAAGQGGNLALKANGTLIAWGDWAALPPGLSNVVAIAAGYTHYLAVRADATVVSWGYNGSGQTNVPAGLSGVVSVSGGFAHSLALRGDGTVVAWGENDYGQCNVPNDLTNAVAVAAGFRHSLALKQDGAIVAWGLNNSGQSAIPGNIHNAALLAAGVTHNLADTDNLQPQAIPQSIPWPANLDLVITLSGNDLNGDILTYRIVELPALGVLYQFTNGVRGAAILNPDTSVADVAHRLIFAPALNSSGKPYATFRFLANDGGADSSPATVSMNIGNVFVSTQFPTLIRQDTATLNGMVLANGLSSVAWFEWGERGSPTNATDVFDAGTSASVFRVSRTLAGLKPRTTYQYRLAVSNVAGVVYGASKVFATGNKLSAWGYNVYGQGSVPTGLSNMVAVSAGDYFNVALKADGKVAAWGNNTYGQTNVPATLSNVVAVSAGSEFSIALRADGTLAAWGHNDLGQTKVPTGLSNVVAIAAGSKHGLALRADGSVIGWGWNAYGQTNVPAGISNIVALAAGEAHSVVLRADGAVVSWGIGTYGLTTPPLGASNVVDIAAKYYDSAALKADGTIAVWGNNSAGQTNVPASVSNVCAIAIGNLHNLALKSTGTSLAWGGNGNGQASVPQALEGVTSIAAGLSHSVAVGYNLAPRASSNTLSGIPNHDLVITLAGSDPNGDPVRLRVIALPSAGTLYQCTNGVRGAAITNTFSLVSDPSSRVVFAPAMNDYGNPYADFNFVANDGETDSAQVSVTLAISPLTNPVITGLSIGTNGSYVVAFKGDSNTTYCVWASTNLVIWESLGQATKTTPGKFVFSDSSASLFPRRFYRISTGCLGPAAQFLGYGRSIDGSFELQFAGGPSSAYRVWASTNLADWQALGIATETEPGHYRFVDLSAKSRPKRFYRVGTP